MKKVVVLLILSMLYMSPSFGYPPEYPYYQSDNIMYYVFEGLTPCPSGTPPISSAMNRGRVLIL